jgi:hypothetical protein
MRSSLDNPKPKRCDLGIFTLQKRREQSVIGPLSSRFGETSSLGGKGRQETGWVVIKHRKEVGREPSGQRIPLLCMGLGPPLEHPQERWFGLGTERYEPAGQQPFPAQLHEAGCEALDHGLSLVLHGQRLHSSPGPLEQVGVFREVAEA